MPRARRRPLRRLPHPLVLLHPSEPSEVVRAQMARVAKLLHPYDPWSHVHGPPPIPIMIPRWLPKASLHLFYPYYFYSSNTKCYSFPPLFLLVSLQGVWYNVGSGAQISRDVMVSNWFTCRVYLLVHPLLYILLQPVLCSFM